MRKICLFNQDNNSLLSLNIFAKIAREGKRILIIDLRENKKFEKENNNNIGLDISTCMSENQNPLKYLTSLEPNLDVIKGNFKLNFEEFELFHKLFKFDYFENKFSKLDYDYLIFETSSQLNLITINSLFYANEIITVIDFEKLGIEFIHKLSSFINNFNKIYYKKLFISKIIPTYKNTLKKHDLIHLISSYSSKLISYPIPQNKTNNEFSFALNEIFKSIFADGNIFDSSINTREKQKLIDEYIEIVNENINNYDLPLKKFIK